METTVRLIDANVAINEIESLIGGKMNNVIIYQDMTETEKYFVYMVLFGVKELLKEYPIVDAEPVRRGDWVKSTKKPNINGDWFNCCACGHGIYLHEDMQRYDLPKYKYCPNCGAKMTAAND